MDTVSALATTVINFGARPGPVWPTILTAAATVAAAVVAVFWSTLQAHQRGRRFRALIGRELAEIGPYPEAPVPVAAGQVARPWWEYARKRFIHEEIFVRDNITANREFLLSIDPTIVYEVSQLWLALEKRDGNQWMHYLTEISGDPRLTSAKLVAARDRWQAIMDTQDPRLREPTGAPTHFRQSAALNRTSELFKARLQAYGDLLPTLDYGRMVAEGVPPGATADAMRAWFYKSGNGLLLSGRSLDQYKRTERALREADCAYPDLEKALSWLRTDLKIDLGVRQPAERDVASAWPEEDRW